MKTILFNAEKTYESPVVFEIKVNVERGFANTGNTEAGKDEGNLDDDDFWG